MIRLTDAFVLPLFFSLFAPVALPADRPIPVKVVVVAMFEIGQDTGDRPGEFQLWVEREHLNRVFPMPNAYHPVRMNQDGVLGMLTGVGTARAAASVMALGSDPRFDLSKAYWIVAGIGGGDPHDISLGSAVWVRHVVDGDLAYEVDAREMPPNWTTGYVPLRKRKPYEQPVGSDLAGELYTLKPEFVEWALQTSERTQLPDSTALAEARSKFIGFPNASKPPFVTAGDTLSASTFWHGELLENWANDWTRYFTGGSGNYMISAMEDSGTMQSLSWLAKAGKVDVNRVLVLRTASNYDRPAPGITAAQNLAAMETGGYAGFLPAVEAAQRVGDVVVRYLVAHWDVCRDKIPGQ